MCSVATNLQKGDALPDTDEVARYCPPSRFDRYNNEPFHTAFMRRPREKAPSVNRLQTFVDLDRDAAVDHIRQEVDKQVDLRPHGRFVVLGVKQAKDAVKGENCDINIVYDPKLPDQPSHSLIIQWPCDEDAEVKAATAIKRLIAPGDVYKAKL